jgi:hypothetical protein
MRERRLPNRGLRVALAIAAGTVVAGAAAHATPEGQASIAAIVLRAVRGT